MLLSGSARARDMLARSNPRVLRSSILVDPTHHTANLQVLRLLKEADNENRRHFTLPGEQIVKRLPALACGKTTSSALAHDAPPPATPWRAAISSPTTTRGRRLTHGVPRLSRLMCRVAHGARVVGTLFTSRSPRGADRGFVGAEDRTHILAGLRT